MLLWGAYINTPMIYPGTKFQSRMTSPSDVTGVFIENFEILEEMTWVSFNWRTKSVHMYAIAFFIRVEK